MMKLITLPCYPHSTSPIRFFCLLGTYFGFDLTHVDPHKHSFSIDSLAMYGLNVKYEIHH